MVNPTGKKLEKLLFGIFDEAIQGVDTYNHNGSMWLIFTDEMKWVVEYTKSQTLWYNYYFFKNEMEIIGLDCVENKDLIQKWFESRFLNIDPVESTRAESFHFYSKVEDTIQNGVKHIKSNVHPYPKEVEDTIQNGVKGSTSLSASRKPQVEQTIQNGVKHTLDIADGYQSRVEDTIQNGVKETILGSLQRKHDVEGAIQNGVKKIRWNGELGTHLCEDVIENGKNYLNHKSIDL